MVCKCFVCSEIIQEAYEEGDGDVEEESDIYFFFINMLLIITSIFLLVHEINVLHE